MPYIFGKLWHLAIIWAIRNSFQCILQGVRFLLANQTRLSGTSDNESYGAFGIRLFFICLFYLSENILLTAQIETVHRSPSTWVVPQSKASDFDFTFTDMYRNTHQTVARLFLFFSLQRKFSKWTFGSHFMKGWWGAEVKKRNWEISIDDVIVKISMLLIDICNRFDDIYGCWKNSEVVTTPCEVFSDVRGKGRRT